MKKILIVDDQPQVQELLKVTFEFDDYHITFAEDGYQAIQSVRTERPDIILLDIMMPDSELDGLEVCRHLKADPITAGITIILLSAKAKREDIETGLAAGADDYFIKPFSPVALMQRIEKEFQHVGSSGTILQPFVAAAPIW
jgi:two-component system phosphate regulon response regulator PhoB